MLWFRRVDPNRFRYGEGLAVAPEDSPATFTTAMTASFDASPTTALRCGTNASGRSTVMMLGCAVGFWHDPLVQGRFRMASATARMTLVARPGLWECRSAKSRTVVSMM